jgi:hypothetical protein
MIIIPVERDICALAMGMVTTGNSQINYKENQDQVRLFDDRHAFLFLYRIKKMAESY